MHTCPPLEVHAGVTSHDNELQLEWHRQDSDFGWYLRAQFLINLCYWPYVRKISQLFLKIIDYIKCQTHLIINIKTLKIFHAQVKLKEFLLLHQESGLLLMLSLIPSRHEPVACEEKLLRHLLSNKNFLSLLCRIRTLPSNHGSSKRKVLLC